MLALGERGRSCQNDEANLKLWTDLLVYQDSGYRLLYRVCATGFNVGLQDGCAGRDGWFFAAGISSRYVNQDIGNEDNIQISDELISPKALFAAFCPIEVYSHISGSLNYRHHRVLLLIPAVLSDCE